jgi:hypothetical protein
LETAPIPIGTTIFDGAFLREDFSFISKPISNVDDFLAGTLEYARLWSILRPTYGQKWKTAWERFYVTPREIVAKPFAIDPSPKNWWQG